MKRPRFIAQQSSHPQGLVGNVIARIMAAETVPENLHALSLLELQAGDRFLDIGTGHGSALLKAAQSCELDLAAGIDPSTVMVNLASRRARVATTTVDIQIKQATVASIPFPDRSFNKLLTVHTIYFWDELRRGLEEIFRVTAPGGLFVSCFRPGEDQSFRDSFPDGIYQKHSKTDVLNATQRAGFTLARNADHPSDERLRPLAFVVAKKPVGVL